MILISRSLFYFPSGQTEWSMVVVVVVIFILLLLARNVVYFIFYILIVQFTGANNHFYVDMTTDILYLLSSTLDAFYAQCVHTQSHCDFCSFLFLSQKKKNSEKKGGKYERRIKTLQCEMRCFTPFFAVAYFKRERKKNHVHIL